MGGFAWQIFALYSKALHWALKDYKIYLRDQGKLERMDFKEIKKKKKRNN